MKHILLYTSLLLALIFSSCIKDLGNYDYQNVSELLPVKISGINDTTMLVGDVLKINPIIEGITDQSRYSYCWYTMQNRTPGSASERTDLASTKNLEIRIDLLPDDYFLYLEVRDKEKDIYAQSKVKLKVYLIPINNGHYVLKSIDNETDFDYIDKDGEMYTDVLQNYASGNRLKGEPVAMAYQTNYYHQSIDNEGNTITLSNQKVFHIMSSQDMKTFNSANMDLFKNLNEQFYSFPEKWEPQNVIFDPSSTTTQIINNGKVHIIPLNVNVGKFSSPYLTPTPSFFVHKDIHCGLVATMVFDIASHSFYSYDPFSNSMMSFPNKDGIVSLKNMNVRLVNMISNNSSRNERQKGYAVMQSLSDKDQYYLATTELYDGSTYPFTDYYTLPKRYNMPKAAIKAMPMLGNFIYYANNDNKLYAHIHAKDLEEREILIKSFEPSEKITFVNHFHFNGSGTSYSYLAVLTNTDSSWKLYLFDFVGPGTPEIQATPYKIYTGKGKGHSVMLR